MKTIKNIDNDEMYVILTCFVMFSEIGKDLWNHDDKKYAFEYYQKKYSNITLEHLSEKYGKNQFDANINEILKARVFELEVMSNIVKEDQIIKCNNCGKNDVIYEFPFLLSREIERKRDWTKTIVSIGLSAITIPLFGRGIFSLPGSEKKYKAFRLNYKLCSECKKNHEGLFGKIKISKYELASHPSCIQGKKIGYNLIKYLEEMV